MMVSRPVTLKAGLFSTLPSTVTRPSAISFSASRREQMPARAITFAMRSPSGVEEGLWGAEVMGPSLAGAPPNRKLALVKEAGTRQGPAMTAAPETPIRPMDAALAEAEAAAARGEVPVGAVVTAPDGQIVARAGNRTL